MSAARKDLGLRLREIATALQYHPSGQWGAETVTPILEAAALAEQGQEQQSKTAAEHFSFGKYELEDMAKNPRVLAALMGYHEARQTEADAFFDDEVRTTGNALRKQALYERGRSIMAEDIDIWDNELRAAFGFPLYTAPPPQAVPAGFVLVPVEPTWDMKIAASTAYREARDGHYTARMEQAADCWAAMLASRPQAEQSPTPKE